MKKLLRYALAFIFLMCSCSLLKAQTTLSPGDVAVVGYDFSYNTTTTAPIGSDNFDIVVLKNVAAGTVIQFTSNGWTGSAFSSVGTIDGFFTWTVGSNITAGTVFNFSIANGTLPATVTVTPSNGTISGVTSTEFTSTVGFSPSTGNQVLIFQGTTAAPTFIYGINTNATNVGANGWVTGAVANNAAQSALPTGLTNSNPFNGTVSAPSALPFTLETARYNAVYTGPLVGSQTTLLTDIGNYANWTATATATAPYDLSVGGANFSSSNPVFDLSSPTITASGTLAALTTTSGTASSSTSFSVSATGLSAGVLVTPPSGFQVSTDNTTFTSTVTVGSSGTLAATTIYVRLAAADAVNSYSGNIVLSSSGATSVNVATASSTVTAAPTTISSITDVSSNLTNASTVQYTATFGASVTGVSTSNFSLATTGSVSGASITSVSGSGTTYTITVNTGTGDGTIGLNLANATGLSPGITTTVPFTGSTYTIDKTAPAVTISAPSVSSTSAGPVSYTLTWSDANLNTASISLAAAQVIINPTGTANYGSIAVTGSGVTRTVTIGSITGTGTLGISLPSGTASDNAGNTTGAAGPSTTFTVTAATTINSITDVSSGQTSASTVQYTATFGAAITGLTTSNFSLTTTGSISGASITTISGSGTTYTITVNTGTGDGTIGLNLANATGLSPGISTTLPFAGSTYTIDKTAPTVTISAPSVTIANSSAAISYTVTFTDAGMKTSTLNNFSALTVFENSHVTGTATINSISVSSTYVQSGNNYSFTVTFNDMTGDGTLGFTVPAGTVSDNAGNASSASSASGSLIVDNTPPAITFSAPSVASTVTGPVSYTITWSDPNLNTASISLSVFDIIVNTTGSANYSSLSLSGSGTTRTVTVGGTSGTGTISISVPSGTASDNAGNVALAAGPSATFAVAPPSPAIAASGTLSALSSTYGSVSASESFNVSGSNMNAGILVTPPTGFEVSTNNSTFSSAVTVGAAGTVASTPIYIRLIAGNAAGNYSGNVVLSSTGATSVNEAIASSTVAPAPLTITANNQTKVYGAAIPTLTASYAGFVNGDTPGSLTTAPTLSTTATAASQVAGNPYAITASGAVDANYAVSFVPGTLTIGQAPLTITADNQTKVYGAAIPTLTASYAGFVNGDTPGSLTTAPTLSTTATAASQVAGNPYAITASGAVDANYAISFVPGTLTIGQAPLTITADNQTKVYGAAIPTLTASYAGFVNGDTPGSLTTAPTLSTTATAASQVAGNPYAITASGAVDANYAISFVPGTLTISQAALTVRADNQSSTYGSALPTLTVSYSGFVNGDTQASLTTPATLITTATAASPAGSYTITATGVADNNYTISNAPGILTIGQAALTITADNQSSTYGQALPALTVSYTGFVNGDTQASLTTAATASTTATTASPAGSYTVTPSGAVDNNYSITYTNGTLTIGQAALTITADNQSSTYGQALPALTVSYSGFVNGDTQASLTTAATASTTATAASPAGSYTVTPSGAVDNNYAITYTNGTLTIGQAALTITANNQSSTYGSALPALTLTYSGFVNGDTQASLTTAATASTIATAASPAGSYTVNPSGAVDNNYAITYSNGTLTIGQAALTITADNQSSTYGQALPALTVSYAGFVNGDTQASLTTAASASTTATVASPAGSYAVIPSGAVDNNYAITYTNGTLTIGQAALTVTADNQSSTYGQALPALTVSYSGFVNGDTQASLTTAASASTTATAASPAGSYTITSSGAVDNNYAITYTNGTLTIGQAALTVTADNQSSTYGQALPPLTVSYSGFVNGDTQASLTTAATASTTATAASPAGSYTVTPSGAVDNNYAITYTNGTLTIGQAALTVTADNQSSTYGQALPALTVSYSGFVNGDTQASLTTAATASTTATAASPTGSYTVTPSGAVDNNYAITYTNGTLTIGQAALTVTADNQSSTYGQALPALTVSYSGFVNGDTQASLTTAATASTTATAASPTGSYTVTPSGAVDNNYAITYTNGTLTIGQAALTVTADNQSSTYGQTLPALTVSYAGFVNGDTQASLTTAATASTTATAASPAGSYTVTPSGVVDNNYAITYTNGTLTIGQAALTITADNQSSTYGQALPALTVSYSGFVNGDTQASLTTAATASTTATAASPAGGYTITPGGAVDNNYAITYTNGVLTIGQATLTVTANNQSSTYGQALPALTVSYSGFVNGDTQASLTAAATASTTATAASPAGSYTITPSGTVDNNYAITYTNGTLTIGQAALTITADNQSSTYGQALPALTVSYAGFVNGDTQASLTTAATASTTATAVSSAGSYTITPSGAIDNNYAITYTNGTLTIDKALLTITSNNQNRGYGNANPPLTVSYNGFVSGDDASKLASQPVVTTTATAVSVAGTYPITASGAASGNYTINYVPGILTIGGATLTITVNNQTKVYGSANPEFTVSYSGFINGDDASKLTAQPVVITSATAGSGAGSYPLTADGAAIPNYTINYVPGTLTVTKAALTVKADNQSRAYGAANPALTLTYSGFVNGDAADKLTSVPVAMTTAGDQTLPGNYLITVSGGTSPNYTFSYIPGTLTISPLTNSSLSNLTLNPVGTILSPGFEPGTFSYTSTVDNQVAQLTITAAFDPSATATIGGAPLVSGQPSGEIVLNAGYNTLTVVVTAQDGAEKTYTITVYRGLPAADISATNILTPNGDGKNDTWLVKDIELYPNNTVTVFDRAGRTVYNKHGYKNDWDGTLKGAPLERGTYYYTIDLGNGGNSIKGFITILRN